jgi:hypothetical protein
MRQVSDGAAPENRREPPHQRPFRVPNGLSDRQLWGDEINEAFQLDLFELRAVDIAISNDMLCCLDALRWGRASKSTLAPRAAPCLSWPIWGYPRGKLAPQIL